MFAALTSAFATPALAVAEMFFIMRAIVGLDFIVFDQALKARCPETRPEASASAFLVKNPGEYSTPSATVCPGNFTASSSTLLPTKGSLSGV